MRLATGVLLFFFSLNVSAEVYKIDPSSGKTQFHALANPVKMKVHGDAQAPQGQVDVKEQKASGQFSFALDQLKTGMDKRDGHMKKALEVEKFPKADLKLTELDLPKAAAKEVPFKADLTLHGITKSIVGKADVEPSATGYKISSHFSVLLSDFKVEAPSYMGMYVADNVDLDVEFEAKK